VSYVTSACILEDREAVFWVPRSNLLEDREVGSCVSPSNFWRTGGRFLIDNLEFLENWKALT
jgi:hypothetical protein